MFKHNRFSDLKIMYKIFKRGENTASLIIVNMKPYIDSRCDYFVKNKTLQANPIAFTQNLLDLKAEIDEIIRETFDNNSQFLKVCDSSFEASVN